MPPVASSTGPGMAGDRSGGGALVIVVAGRFQGGGVGVATAPPAGPVLVVVLGAWPVRVLPPAAGRLPARLVVDGLGVAGDDRRPPLAEGQPGRVGSGSAGRHRDAAEDVEDGQASAVGPATEAGAPRVAGNLFRREGEYWTVGFDGLVVRLRDAKGLGHLARAVGLGGRDRRAAAHAERARVNVTRVIRAAVANLARVHPGLGRHLAVTVRTGRYCAYTPDPRVPIAWQR
jgi:hypothetical protein